MLPRPATPLLTLTLELISLLPRAKLLLNVMNMLEPEAKHLSPPSIVLDERATNVALVVDVIELQQSLGQRRLARVKIVEIRVVQRLIVNVVAIVAFPIGQVEIERLCQLREERGADLYL